MTPRSPSHDAPDTIRAGMSADVSVTTASQTGAIAVPIAALVGRNGNYVVRILDSSGTEQLTPVEVGLVTDTQAAVTSGLTDGATVITGTVSAQQASTGSGTQAGFGGLGGLAGWAAAASRPAASRRRRRDARR